MTIGKHPKVSALLTGIHNKRFPQTRYCFTWDVDTVLKYLISLEINKIYLKHLPLKLTILLALASANRAHE